jgi:tetratricopeptide (TPR) repeat protein
MFRPLLKKTLFCVLIFSISSACTISNVDDPQYGQTTFPNSGSVEAQDAFMEGLLMLHSFEYMDARKAFRKAREIDADFAMAYWGESLTHYRMLWNEIEADNAREVLQALAPTPQARAEKAGTPREQAYLATLEILLTEGDDAGRALRFAEAMELLAADYPDDENAAAFYALALLGSSGADRDYSIYMRSAAVSEAVIAKNPLHPGAVHYLIHAYDDPVHAPLGLPAALTYAGIAPAATHALHMPSHIFFPMGMWQEATDINFRSYAAGKAWGVKNNKSVNGGGAHALTWLIYSLMQEGRMAEARTHMQEFQEIVRQDPARGGQFAETWASYVIGTNYSDAEFVELELDASKMPSRRSSMYHYVKGAAAVRKGDLAAADAELKKLTALEMKLNDLNWSELAQDVMALELKALIAEANGDNINAIELLQKAAKIEFSMPRRFGPPWPPKPSHELLAETLAKSGDHDAAIVQYKIGLSLAKDRTASLQGLTRSAKDSGNDDIAHRAQTALLRNLQRADSDFIDPK